MSPLSLLGALALLCAPLLSSAVPGARGELRVRASLDPADSNSTALSTDQIKLIQDLLTRDATLSWEVGTHAQALLELEYPELSVFSPNYYPPPSSPVPKGVISIANSIVSSLPSNTSGSLLVDGSAGDPASIGVSILVANWTGAEAQASVSGARFLAAAEGEYNFLMNDVPKTSDGAISHRRDTLELWSDFVYMVPPFLAYYGVLTANSGAIQEAYDQARLYRSYLSDGTGLWSHIVLGSSPDPGQWMTGNGWAAAGMLRVYATIQNSDFASQFTSPASDLATWSTQIVTAAFGVQLSSGLMPNYANVSSKAFPEAASAALLAACSYRLAQYSIDNSTLTQAELARQAVYASLGSNGVLAPVVDPLNYNQQIADGQVSPEAEAFVLLMEAARRDWVATGSGEVTTGASPGVESAAQRSVGGGWPTGAVMVGVLTAGLLLV